MELSKERQCQLYVIYTITLTESLFYELLRAIFFTCRSRHRKQVLSNTKS